VGPAREPLGSGAHHVEVAMNPQALLSALRACTVVELEHPRAFADPTFPAHQPGFVYALHRRHEPGLGEPRTSASGLVICAEHSGTHIDALCHQAENLRLHGGIQVSPDVQGPGGFTRLGVEEVDPILARGVLLDVAALHGQVLPPQHQVTAEELAACQRRQALTVGQGDVVAVRTGYGGYWDDPERYGQAAGISAAGSQWLADRRVRAVGADNLCWDVPLVVDDTTGSTLPGHVILLVRAGIYILENLLLEELSQRNAYEFVLVCLPLKMQGVTGSPVRPIALLPPHAENR
jgi:kynurenine formamidase